MTSETTILWVSTKLQPAIYSKAATRVSLQTGTSMRRRSVFKWTTIAIVAMAIVLNVLSMLQRETVSAAATQTRPQTQGSLQVLDDKGKPSAECPLKHTDVKAHVSGFISRVTVTQDFENNFPEKIEAVYTFPLPQAAAADDLTM